MSAPTQAHPSRPWHSHPWPWLLMLAPGIAVIWGMTTLYIAIKYRDPVITEHAWQDGQKLEQAAPAPTPAPRRPADD